MRVGVFALKVNNFSLGCLILKISHKLWDSEMFVSSAIDFNLGGCEQLNVSLDLSITKFQSPPHIIW